MLDKRSELILIEINKQCQSGSFQVIEIVDLISCLPKKYLADVNLVTQCINGLTREGYIETKYHDSEVVCLSPLPKGRIFFESRVEKHHKSKKRFWIALGVIILLMILLILTSVCGVLIYDKIRGA